MTLFALESSYAEEQKTNATALIGTAHFLSKTEQQNG